jgi:hypothetical protein
MTYKGHFKNGVVVFDEPPGLAEGVAVQVSPLQPLNGVPDQPDPPTWAEVLKDFIGQVKDLPTDMARNHNHYIHRARKR